MVLRCVRVAPPFSHFLLGDDCLLLCRANEQKCSRLKEVLNEYKEVSGQAINYTKLGVFFSKNVTIEARDSLSNILGVHNPLDTRKFLGLPLLVGL